MARFSADPKACPLAHIRRRWPGTGQGHRRHAQAGACRTPKCQTIFCGFAISGSRRELTAPVLP